MRDYGPLYKVITDQWFQDEPTRIVWFTRLLNAVDDGGVVAMSRAKFGRLFNCTADAAFYFLQQLEKRNLLTRNSHANCTQITICNIEGYDMLTRKLHANCTQKNDTTRNLHAICTQTSSSKSDDYDISARNLCAERAQKSRKENRKENTLPPTPPIIKEKIKEKKTLPLRYAPDFVGDVSTASAKELEKQKRAEQRKAKSNERKQKEQTLVHKARGIFEAYYSELYDDSYYWTAKDAVAMKRLIKKITFGRTNRTRPLPCDDDSLLEALKVFLKMINKSWIMNNFSVTKIDSQYNDIVSEIKNKNNSAYGNRNQAGQTASTALLANQAANLLNDIAKADELYYRGEQGGESTPQGDEAK